MSNCIHSNNKVTDSRKLENFIWRRRECKDCNERFTTIEVPLNVRSDDNTIGHSIEKRKGLMTAFYNQYGNGLAGYQIDTLISLLEQFKK